MFYALAAGRIDTGGLQYLHELQDIETLNERALRGELEVSAVSIHALAYLTDRYALLPHGASMGSGYGPRLVASRPSSLESLRGARIAVPGMLTTAYLALRLCLPEFEPIPTAFDRIEDAVTSGTVDAGVLIHEGQLTYADAGLNLVADMGSWWFGETGLPLPLGGNVVRKDLGQELMRTISRHLRESIAYGLAHREEALSYAMKYARGLEIARADEFVGMYVNDWTLDYGETGRAAVNELLNRGMRAGVIPRGAAVEFVQ